MRMWRSPSEPRTLDERSRRDRIADVVGLVGVVEGHGRARRRRRDDLVRDAVAGVRAEVHVQPAVQPDRRRSSSPSSTPRAGRRCGGSRRCRPGRPGSRRAGERRCRRDVPPRVGLDVDGSWVRRRRRARRPRGRATRREHGSERDAQRDGQSASTRVMVTVSGAAAPSGIPPTRPLPLAAGPVPAGTGLHAAIPRPDEPSCRCDHLYLVSAQTGHPWEVRDADWTGGTGTRGRPHRFHGAGSRRRRPVLCHRVSDPSRCRASPGRRPTGLSHRLARTPPPTRSRTLRGLAPSPLGECMLRRGEPPSPLERPHPDPADRRAGRGRSHDRRRRSRCPRAVRSDACLRNIAPSSSCTTTSGFRWERSARSSAPP